VMRAYVEGDAEYFKYAKYEKHWHPDTCRTLMDQVNWAFRQGSEHRYAWDEETLLLALADAGFVDGRRRDFDPELDDERRGAYGNLLVEARKPSYFVVKYDVRFEPLSWCGGCCGPVWACPRPVPASLGPCFGPFPALWAREEKPVGRGSG